MLSNSDTHLNLVLLKNDKGLEWVLGGLLCVSVTPIIAVTKLLTETTKGRKASWAPGFRNSSLSWLGDSGRS